MKVMVSEDRLYSRLGKRIQAARKKAKLTQIELAQQISLTRTSVTNIESGQQKIQVHVLYAIAKALNISVQDLLPDVELEETAIEERLPENLRPEEREWILGLLDSTAKESKV